MIFRGQTLLSLMISLSLSSLLLLSTLSFYQYNQREQRQLLLHLELQNELQRIIQLIAKDIRRAGFRQVSSQIKITNWHLFEQKQQSLFISQSSKEAKNSCVLFFYDLDASSCLGSKHKDICVKDNLNTSKVINEELFGYRLSKGKIETRLTYKSAVENSCEFATCQSYLQQPACDKGGWANLLDSEKYQIEQLTFNWIIDKKAVEIFLLGSFKQNKKIQYESTLIVPLLNNEEIP